MLNLTTLRIFLKEGERESDEYKNVHILIYEENMKSR